MNNQWSLETHGDPLGTLRDFITKIWTQNNLGGMLVTIGGNDEINTTPQFITDQALIGEVNPFKPLMEVNAARQLPGLLDSHPSTRIGALLRPCEYRALIEMKKHVAINTENLLTLCVDCLGTLPADEYQWRLERMKVHQSNEDSKASGAHSDLATEAIKFARQGGIVPYRYRAACQVCVSPAASHADINIHILGLPVRQNMLVTQGDASSRKLNSFDKVVDGKATADLILMHDRMISRMAARHQRTMDRLDDTLGELLPADVDAVIRQLESCGACQSCMEACPICSVDQPTRASDGRYDRMSITRWLVSCAGCGMCEQACPRHLPTAIIFAHIRQQLAQQWEYSPGRSLEEPLPLI